MKFRRVLGVVVFLSLLVGGFVAVNHAQEIIDWWKLRDYTPSADIEALAQQSGMNDEGRKLFYVNDPIILQKPNFSNKCTVGEETIVLGCYVSGVQRIYLFDVQDDRLNGVEEVTAAHEMLHSAYDRLSISEKNKIDSQLTTAFSKIDDPRIIDTVESYKTKDDSIINNELHSILGTEVEKLPASLENYYAQYFYDRKAVVKLANQYSGEFTKREKTIAAYDKQLNELKGDITRQEASISLQAKALNQERILIEGLSNNPSSYNAAVGSYNVKVNTYNNGINTLKTLIAKYNKVVEDRNAIALEERELVNAIDTRTDTSLEKL